MGLGRPSMVSALATGCTLALAMCTACRAAPEPTPCAAPTPRAAPTPHCSAEGAGRASLEAARSFWERAHSARERGDAAATRELLACARGMLERVTGSPAQLDAFQFAEPVVWDGAVAYWAATSAVSNEQYVVQTLVDRRGAMLTPLFALKGAPLSSFARRGEQLVLRDEEALLLYRDRESPPTRFSGSDALFVPGGRLLIFGTERLELVDVATLRQRSILTGAPVAARGEFVEAGRLFVSFSGGTDCARDTEPGLALIDLDAGSVRLEAPGDISEVSASGRYAAVLARELVSGTTRTIVYVWDLRNLAHGPVRADLGELGGATLTLQFDAAEQSVIVSDCGMAGAGRFEGFSARAMVDVRDGTLHGPPPAAATPPRDPTERWERLSASFASLATEQLVPTERGPGRFLSYAETTDRSLIALLAGNVTVSEVQRVSDPAVLFIDARSGQLKQRVRLPFTRPTARFTSGLLQFAPTRESLLVCLEGEGSESALVNIASQTVMAVPRSCPDWSFSADGVALLAPDAAWDVLGGWSYQLPFAPQAKGVVEDWLARGARRSEPAPPWLVCRSRAVLAPADVCLSTEQ